MSALKCVDDGLDRLGHQTLNFNSESALHILHWTGSRLLGTIDQKDILTIDLALADAYRNGQQVRECYANFASNFDSSRGRQTKEYRQRYAPCSSSLPRHPTGYQYYAIKSMKCSSVRVIEMIGRSTYFFERMYGSPLSSTQSPSQSSRSPQDTGTVGSLSSIRSSFEINVSTAPDVDPLLHAQVILLISLAVWNLSLKIYELADIVPL